MIPTLQTPADSAEYVRYHSTGPDGGPIYTETDFSHFIVEPWNAVSSLFIIIPGIYWLWRLRGQYKDYAFIISCTPLLILGGLGSTFFHAFRNSPWLLLMDVLPIMLLSVAVMVFLWLKVFRKWWQIFYVLVPYFLMVTFLFGFSSGLIAEHTAINISYFFRGALMFLPIIIMLFRTRFAKVGYLVGTVLFFALSLFFREIDARAWQPFPNLGTHFLWHGLSAVGAYFLSAYIVWITEHTRKKPRKTMAPA